MGKRSRYKDSSNYNHKSVWLAGMLHVLNFHHWRTKNRPICWKPPRTQSLVRDDEKIPLLDSKNRNSKKMISVVADNKPSRQLKKMMMTTKQFLEILRKEEDVYVKILKDPDSEFGKQVHIKSNSRVLPKSTIEHKQKENWSAPKQNSAVLTLNVPRVVTSQESKSVLPSYDHGFNYSVINGFKEIKKFLKNAMKDRKPTKQKRKHSAASKEDSLGRYSQLLQQLRAKSLRISYEEKKSDPRDDNKPQFSRQISSLSSLEVLSSFLTEFPGDNSSPDIETRKSLDHQDTNFGSKKSLLLSESLVGTEKEEKDKEKEQRNQENHLDSSNQRVLQQQDPDSVPSTGSSQDTAQKTETSLLQSLGLSSFEIYNYEEEDEDACFSYVKKVLGSSGFLENKYNGEKWYSEEQPLNPSLLYELEIQEEAMDKVLLFDLVNEAIAETHNQSYIYFPKSNWKRFLDEVWGRVEWSISGLGTEIRDRSLNGSLGRDLRKGDGWMNLQAESEWLALELEDMIFDEVLDDILCV